jgi:hypothetical protein
MIDNDEPRIEFKVKEEDGSMVELLRLDTKGFLYKGEYIRDAGEAHDAFLETMDKIKKAKTAIPDMLTTFAIGFSLGYALCYFGLQ